MAIYKLIRKQVIPADIATLWDFFKDPSNLTSITPSYMNFVIKTMDTSNDIYAGQMITYRVAPIAKIPLFWMTEITAVVKHQYFIDEQRRGPYKMWHHQHHFSITEQGVEMTDIVHYELPFGILGQFAHWLFVKKQLNQIFNYRFEKIATLFN
jgi:ligand-binding SRPBCC domain-containing protein